MDKRPINRRLLTLGESPTLQVADRVRELEREGQKVIQLQTGDPDFPTPEVIVEAAHQAMKAGHTHYSSTRGLPELRKAIAEKLKMENDVEYDPRSEILVTHGGVHAISVALSSLINDGDEVLILDPCWTPYVASTVIAGGKPVRVPTTSHSGFKLHIGDIEAEIGERTKVLLINSPCNPSGTVLTREELESIAALAIRYGMYVIADEVYEKLVYDDARHLSLASLPGMRDRTITVNSFSKTFAMTGWRLGYLAANADLCQQMLKTSQYSITNVSTFIQKAGVIALSDERVAQSVQEMMDSYSRRRQMLMEALDSVDRLGYIKPMGAFYFLLDISRCGPSSTEFARMLLERQKVAVVPGTGFGECGEGFVRLTFAAADRDLETAITRIAQLVKRLPE